MIPVSKKYGIFSETSEIEGRSFSASDDISAKGFQAAAGSRLLEGYRPVFDATAVARMREHLDLMGKTNMDEFGAGSFSVTGFEIPKNPFDPERSCGGSSGGAACAASIIDGHTALGTSASGSISVPAAFCGVIGITPTHGRVSRYGQIDSVSSMGPIGILASDAAIVKKYLPVISGKDANDPITSAQPELKFDKVLKSVAVPKGIDKDMNKDMRKAFNESIEALKSMSVDIEYAEMPNLKYAVPAHYILCAAETASGLAKYCGMRCGRQDGDLSMPFNDYFTHMRTKYFGNDVKLRIMMGTYVTMGNNRKELYLRSLGIRRMVLDEYKRVLETHDAVLTPSAPYIAPKFDEIHSKAVDQHEACRFAVPPVFCGLPSVSVPCGYSEGMPLGMQFVSGHWNESVLVSAAELCMGSFDMKRPEVTL